jgi:lipoyl(octanoyl) transferase
LAAVTRETLLEFGVDSRWDACKPGLYTERGKIVSIGLKIKQGISTHGLSINVSNRLEDFALIRACGEAQMPVDRFPQPVRLEAVFNAWVRRFQAHI